MEAEFTQQGFGQHYFITAEDIITTHYDVRISIPERVLYVYCNVELCYIHLYGHRKVYFALKYCRV